MSLVKNDYTLERSVMSEIAIGFGRTLIEEKPTGEHCFNCGDVMFEKQFRAWMTCMGEPVKRMTIKRRGEELPIVYCSKCEPAMRATFQAGKGAT